MPREKKYATRAEQQRAYRERKAGSPSETAAAVPEDSGGRRLESRHGEPTPPVAPETSEEGHDRDVPERTFSSAMTEDDYVRMNLAQTMAHLERIHAPEKKEKLAIQERLMRAEAYARWRWQAYHAG